MQFSRITIPLVLVTLALSLAAVALIINGALTLPTLHDIAVACTDALPTSPTPATCPTGDVPTSEPVVIPPAADHPGFSYPLGWNAFLSSPEGKTVVTVAGTGLFNPACTGATCTDTTFATITTEPYTLAATQTLDSYVQGLFAANPSVVIHKEDRTGGSLYTVTGITSTAPIAPFTYLLFFGQTTEVEIYLPESDLLPVGTAERDAFISSFDFSLIP